MDNVGIASNGLANGLMNLVPGEDFVRSDVKRLPDGLLVADEAEKPLRKVICMCHDPEGRSVTVNDDLLSPLDTVDGCVFGPSADGDRNDRIIGMRRPDDRGRKAFLLVKISQFHFTCDFVARVLPERVRQWSRFGDNRMLRRPLIRRGGADEDVLLRFAPKKLVVSLNILFTKRDPIDDGVPFVPFESGREFGGIRDVADDCARTGQSGRPLSPIQKMELDSSLDAQPAHGSTDVSRSSDE